MLRLPYLSKNAVVIMDDQLFAFEGENRAAFCTRILNMAVVADRLYLENPYTDKMTGFSLNEDSNDNLANLWLALMIPWEYSLGEYEEDYKKIIYINYSTEEYDAFCKTLMINNNAMNKKELIAVEIKKIINIASSSGKTYIFGAGQRGQALKSFLLDRGIEIDGFLVSAGRESEIGNANCKSISEVELYSNDTVLLAVADETAKENLDNMKIEYYQTPNYIYPFLKQFATVINLMK